MASELSYSVFAIRTLKIVMCIFFIFLYFKHFNDGEYEFLHPVKKIYDEDPELNTRRGILVPRSVATLIDYAIHITGAALFIAFGAVSITEWEKLKEQILNDVNFDHKREKALIMSYLCLGLGGSHIIEIVLICIINIVIQQEEKLIAALS